MAGSPVPALAATHILGTSGAGGTGQALGTAPQSPLELGGLGGLFLLHPLAEVAALPSLCQPGCVTWSSPRRAPLKSQIKPQI